eukprot:2653414-Amphidinium_carterae.2
MAGGGSTLNTCFVATGTLYQQLYVDCYFSLDFESLPPARARPCRCSNSPQLVAALFSGQFHWFSSRNESTVAMTDRGCGNSKGPWNRGSQRFA